MTIYETILWIDGQLALGAEIPAWIKEKTVELYLAGVSPKAAVSRFHKSVNAYNAQQAIDIDSGGDPMYPFFYITPYNDGKKLKTVNGVTPKTHILAANSYELEIMRQLFLFAPENETVKYMLQQTLRRLKTTCFGNFCSAGECFETSIAALRFIASVFPDETEMTAKLIGGINSHMADKKRRGGTAKYYNRVLGEINANVR